MEKPLSICGTKSNKMNSETNTQWRLGTKYLVAVGLVMFALYIIHLMRPVLSLLILASLIAMVANPTIRFLHLKLKIPRGAAVAITYLLASLLILSFLFLLLPPIANAVNFLGQLDYAGLIDHFRAWVETFLIQLRANDLQILGFRIVMDPIVDPVLSAIQNAGSGVQPAPPSLPTLFSSLGQALTTSLTMVVGVAGSVVSGVAWFFLMILASIYICQDADKFREWIVNIFPPAYQPEIESLIYRLSNTWNSFFKGQFLLMIVVGAMVWLGATILGLPGALALGFISGIMELLPSIGPVLAIIPAIIVALTQGSSHLAVSNWVFTLIVIAFYVAVQQIENTLIVPKLMSKAVKLHPLVLILGIFVGALTYGILGAILAAPVIASMKEIVRYLYLKIRGLPVEVDTPVEPSSFGSIPFPKKPGPLKQEETGARKETLAEEEPPETVE
jgi:predicted PurR-regulated permease PerM